MDTGGPAYGPGRDEDPDRDFDWPGRVTPDWMDEAEWQRYCAAGNDDEELYLNPEDDGPPADLAEVPLEVITAQAQTDGAEHAALMARLIAAGLDGYAHRRGAPPVPGVFSGPAAGFGQGMCLDAAVPCSTVSAMADEASGEDRTFADVTDDQLMGLLGTRQRLQARQEWELLMAVAEFIRRRPGPGCALEGPERMPEVWHEHACSELTAQLHITRHAADNLLGLAHDLTVKLPGTAAALRDGIIDAEKAHTIALRCSVLTPDEARAAEALLFAQPDVDEMTWSMIRDRIGRAVIEVNPEAAVRRRKEAAKQRRVEVAPEDSGGMMPGVGAIDPLLVRDLAAAASRNSRSTWCLTITDPDGRPVAHGCGRLPPKRGRPGHRSRAGPVFTAADRGPPGTGTLRLNLAAFARTTETRARDLEFILEPLAGPCDHRHQAAGHDPGAMLRHLTGILNACCTFPPCRRPAAQSDYEHSVPFEAGGRTCLCEAGPVCRHNHRDKQAPGWHLEQAGSRGWFRWITPSGRSYLSGPTRYPS